MNIACSALSPHELIPGHLEQLRGYTDDIVWFESNEPTSFGYVRLTVLCITLHASPTCCDERIVAQDCGPSVGANLFGPLRLDSFMYKDRTGDGANILSFFYTEDAQLAPSPLVPRLGGRAE